MKFQDRKNVALFKLKSVTNNAITETDSVCVINKSPLQETLFKTLQHGNET